jgi:transcriptional regulator GlxA family with amidase domain
VQRDLSRSFHPFSVQIVFVGKCRYNTDEKAVNGLRKVLYRTLVESNIHRSLTVQDIAAHAGLCVSEFARRFRGSVGRSPKQIIISIRMRRAAMLLCDTELSPKEIALIVGVRWIGSFGRMFRAVYGVPPAAYRLQRRAQRSEKPVR